MKYIVAIYNKVLWNHEVFSREVLYVSYKSLLYNRGGRARRGETYFGIHIRIINKKRKYNKYQSKKMLGKHHAIRNNGHIKQYDMANIVLVIMCKRN